MSTLSLSATFLLALFATVVESAPASSPDPTPPGRETELTVGAQVWLRGQGRMNGDFRSRQGSDQGAVLQRARLQVRGRYGPAAAFVQVQDARQWGAEASTANNDANTDLHQGYLELGGASQSVAGYVRAGRQEISYGTMRLIGHLPWAPTARSFDAIRGHAEVGKFSVDGFGAILERPQAFTVEATGQSVTNDGSQLYAAQLAYAAHPLLTVEVLGLLGRLRPNPSAVARDKTILSPDAHVFGKARGFFYDVEGSVQRGTAEGRSHRAWAWAAFAGYRVETLTAKPGLRAGIAQASGQACTGTPEEGCGGRDSTEFFNFYPTNHIHYGLVDLAGWRNIRDVDVRALLGSNAPLEMAAAYHYLALTQTTGAWKNAAGALVGAGWDPDNQASELGHEVDLTATYKPIEGLMLQGGYGVFVPGQAGRRLAGPDPQHFAWLWIVFDLEHSWRPK